MSVLPVQAAVVVRGLMVSFPSVWKNEEESEKFMVSIETFPGFWGFFLIFYFFPAGTAYK